MQKIFTLCIGVFACLLLPRIVQAQKNSQQALNPGASFLLVNPDARSTGTGDALTGLESDVNSQFANGAKLVFAGDMGIAASYSPWMWDLNNSNQRVNLGHLAAFKSFNDHNEAIGVTMRYFSHGTITFRDQNGTEMQQYRPKEYAIDATYARKLGDRYSIAIALRYIRSDLGQGNFNSLSQHPASAVAGDISLYYENYAKYDPAGNRFCWGISFSNLGSKLKYTDDGNRHAFLPMNLRIGGGYTFVNTIEHQFTILADIQKLLIPTPPTYKLDSAGGVTDQILKGRDPNRGIPEAIFTSFYDAPGGFSEEIREITAGGGLEYSYKHQLYIRTGYFYESPTKGWRQHFSSGIGLQIQGLSVDMAYIIPTGNSLYPRRTLKFTLAYNFGRYNKAD
ncbi:type IX secretion system outer membrane channel protein PorV [Chitinophaga sp.]|uniref:type IX secretion system outer membrane channel protein PorV n=1 Tax=Chitinophaga sp. TaxID=1869181 RepID=UPI0031D5EB29